MKTNLFVATLIMLAIFLSGCEIYKTLYNVPSPVGDVVQVPEEDIAVEETTEETETSELTEEKEDAETEKIAEETEIEEKPVKTEESSGESAVIIVEETNLISLAPKAEDPDKDKLDFIFTTPLDENGKWQTTYGDAGEYTVTVTVSDGELTSSKDVLIIVNRKEEAPAITSFMPEESAVSVDETGTIDFNVAAMDLNKDELAYLWKLDGVEVSDEDSFSYKTAYDDAGSHTIKVAVSDSVLSTENLWSVTVNNANRKPALEEILDITVEETETVEIQPEAFDADDDEIKFTISDPVGADGIWETTYEDSGTYTVTVTAFDGTDEVSQEVTVTVENVNRPPVILDIVQG